MRIMAILFLCVALVVAGVAPPSAALAGEPLTFIAGNFWPDVDAVGHGRALRLWMAFYSNPVGGDSSEAALPEDTPFDEIRVGLIKLYANQTQQLQPETVEEDLEIYLVDSRFEQAMPLSDFTGSLKELWEIAAGEASAGDGVERAFVKRQNPLGVTRQAMAAYVSRIADVTNSKVTSDDIEENAKEWLANLAYQDEPLTGFTLLVAPKDQTQPPYELEIRSPLDISLASRKKPAGHASQPVTGIAASSSMVTQARIKSGVFVDLRLYNGNAQLSFKQSTGKSDAGQCLDLMVYGAPDSLKNLRLGISRAAGEELAGLGISLAHIRICSPGGVTPYAEYWLEVPLSE
ncbi:MAG: hypothetical protein LBS11_05650 [Oscillospiraceae bacterium]|jgi:hypothetical protein|nr:hypothetical protein [Oscillospiraceae bacterium]